LRGPSRPVTEFFEMLAKHGVARCLSLTRPESGLRAFIVLDDLTLGPAVGGVRTMEYASTEEAIADAARLAHAMTLKCSLAGLDRGGAKAVVLNHAGLDRPRAFEQLGKFIEELGGIFQTAGDLGTTADDLAAMARYTRYVSHDEVALRDAAARGWLSCLRACIEVRGLGSLRGLRVAVQGCGFIGSAFARTAANEGATLWVSDLLPARADALAKELGATSVGSAEVLTLPVDVISPCAAGGVLTPDVAANVQAWAVCGGANNQLSSLDAARILAKRGILHVPDFVASAGAVIEGVLSSTRPVQDRHRLIDQLGVTALSILEEASDSGATPTEVAERRGLRRIANARNKT
jgi:leucine dehydrogenase